MFLEDRLNEIVDNLSESNIKNNVKINVELSYFELLDIVVALRNKSIQDDIIINAYNGKAGLVLVK